MTQSRAARIGKCPSTAAEFLAICNKTDPNAGGHGSQRVNFPNFVKCSKSAMCTETPSIQLSLKVFTSSALQKMEGGGVLGQLYKCMNMHQSCTKIANNLLQVLLTLEARTY